MIKEKPCSGSDLASGFPGCGKMIKVENRKFGLCKECLKLWLTTTEKGTDYMNRAMRITKKAHEKENPVIKPFDKKQHKKDKEALKTLSDYEKEAKVVFQKWIRLRDQEQPCISCGIKNNKLWDGGHYFKAELFSGLIFDTRNVNKQCRKCNRYLGGNEIQYRLGMVSRFGLDFVDKLESDSISRRVYKFSKDELIDINKKYQLKIKNNDFKN